MIKKFLKISILLLILLFIFVAYFAYFGIKTSKFNTIIKDQFKKQNINLNIDLKEVKLLLDLKSFSIKIKTINPIIKFNDSDRIQLKEISSNILISAYLNKKFAFENLSINSKKNEISSYINLYRLTGNNLHVILLNQILKSGLAEVNVDLSFDENGKLQNNYNLTGKISNAKLRIPNNKNIEDLNFNFSIKENNYNFDKILFEFNKIRFYSDRINLYKKNDKFHVKGNLKNKKSKINKDIILLFFEEELEKFDFSDSRFDTDSEFTFNLSKNFKIKNIKLESKLNIDELIIKYEFNKIKSYLTNFNNLVKLKENKINFKYSKNKLLVNGSSEFQIEENYNNLINFNIEKINNKINFQTFLNLENIDLKIDDISYKKAKENKASLHINGYKAEEKVFFNKINYVEHNNKIEIINLELNDNKIIYVDNIKLNYLTNNNFKNQISINKKDNNYELLGKSFDALKLIDKISNSSPDKNFFKRFKNLNSKIKIKIDKVSLDELNTTDNLNGNLEIKKNEIFDLNLNSNFSSNEKIFISVKKLKDNSVITTFYSDRAKPFVKKYKFIKGFEGGTLDFTSTKINNSSKSKLIIDNFKVKEIPLLAKILTLASLQGIADLLTGEGVRFTDFEMLYSNKGNLMTIDEIYAIGPAISIMIEGYVEKDKLISLRGTLVPATTINRTISSIPLIGDLLVGKKVGEGVFGVSFKIKGPPKDLKTKVNPIKTLTPRFITRTLEKIKKN